MVTVVEDLKRGFSLGASGYLLKPVDALQLSNVLAQVGSFSGPGHVLIVDDDVDSREYVNRLLRGWGWSVTAVDNGRQAIEFLSSETPDLIVLDLVMPEMDGFEFLRLFRSEAKWKDIPVVVESAMELTPEQFSFMRNNASNIVFKATDSRGEWVSNIASSIRVSMSRNLHKSAR